MAGWCFHRNVAALTMVNISAPERSLRNKSRLIFPWEKQGRPNPLGRSDFRGQVQRSSLMTTISLIFPRRSGLALMARAALTSMQVKR